MNSVNRSFVIDRWLERLPWASGWGGIGLAAGAIVLSLVAFWLAGGLQAYQVFGAAAVHLLFPPLVIVYILVVIRLLERTRENVAQSLRPLVQVEQDAVPALP